MIFGKYKQAEVKSNTFPLPGMSNDFTGNVVCPLMRTSTMFFEKNQMNMTSMKRQWRLRMHKENGYNN